MSCIIAKSFPYTFLENFQILNYTLYCVKHRYPVWEWVHCRTITLQWFLPASNHCISPYVQHPCGTFTQNVEDCFEQLKDWFLSLSIVFLNLLCIPNEFGFSPFRAPVGKTTLISLFPPFMRRFITRIKEFEFCSFIRLMTSWLICRVILKLWRHVPTFISLSITSG